MKAAINKPKDFGGSQLRTLEQVKPGRNSDPPYPTITINCGLNNKQPNIKKHCGTHSEDKLTQFKCNGYVARSVFLDLHRQSYFRVFRDKGLKFLKAITIGNCG